MLLEEAVEVEVVEEEEGREEEEVVVETETFKSGSVSLKVAQAFDTHSRTSLGEAGARRCGWFSWRNFLCTSHLPPAPTAPVPLLFQACLKHLMMTSFDLPSMSLGKPRLRAMLEIVMP